MTKITNLLSTYNLEKDGVSVILQVRHHNKTFEINPGLDALSAADLYERSFSATSDTLNENLQALKITTELMQEAVAFARDLLDEKVKGIPVQGPRGSIGPSGRPGITRVPVDEEIYYITAEDKGKEINVRCHDRTAKIDLSKVAQIRSKDAGQTCEVVYNSGDVIKYQHSYPEVLRQISRPELENRDSEPGVYYLTPEDKQKEIKVVLHDKPVLVKMSDVHYVVPTDEGRRTMFMTDSGRSYRCLSTYNHVLAQIMYPEKKYE